jgi:dihydroxyacid dehydratase/phosphogluconate dehydratase
MLHLRELGLLDTSVRTVTGRTLAENLDAWETSERRALFRRRLEEMDAVSPDEVIFSPARAQERGLTGTVVFPTGNLAPEGSVVKATSIDPSVVDARGVFHLRGPARVFTSESAAIAAIKAGAIRAGEVLVLAGIGPMGTGMEETYQVTSSLKYLPHGKQVALLTDARFSGVSTGACIGHIGPEALAGGPLGKVREGDTIEVRIDRTEMTGSINLVGAEGRDLSPAEAEALLGSRPSHPDLAPHPALPADTRLWAALQQASGGTWGGCVYDPDAIIARLK